MQENKKQLINYCKYSEPGKKTENIAQTIIHVILALFVLGGTYTFFDKIESEPLVRPALRHMN